MLSLQRSNNFILGAAVLALLAVPAYAQYGGEPDRKPTDPAPHATKKTGPPPARAIAVLEWVPQETPAAQARPASTAPSAATSAAGPKLTVSDPDAPARLAKKVPDASPQAPTKDYPPSHARLVPVSIYWQAEYQDAGVFLSRPVPLALEADTVYQLEVAGNAAGTFTLHAPTRTQDAWLGLGSFTPVPPPRPFKPKVHIALGPDADDDATSDRPVLRRRHAESAGDAKPATTSADGKPVGSDDPDRPTLKRHDSSASAPSNASDAGAPPLGSDDPDRPTLHRAAAPAAASTGPPDSAAAKPGADLKTNDNYLNPADDPNRPHLQPGIYQQKQAALPSLLGNVGDVRQTVAVSDAEHEDEHDFAHAWLNAAEKDRARNAMQQLAGQQIAQWKRTLAPKPGVAQVPRKKTVNHNSLPAGDDGAGLVEVQFAAYDLAYQDEPTYVFAAQTRDHGPQQIFACVIARPDIYGNLQVAFSAVTSAEQLSLTPRYRLVDAVDANGDGRAELLLEARNLDGRRFVLLNVYRGVATKVFETTLLP